MQNIFLACFLFSTIRIFSQHAEIHQSDTSKMILDKNPDWEENNNFRYDFPGDSLCKFCYYWDVNLYFMAKNYDINGKSFFKNLQMGFHYNTNQLIVRRLKRSNLEIKIFDELGYEWMGDSFSSKNKDLFRLSAQVYHKNKLLNPMIQCSAQSQIFPDYSHISNANSFSNQSSQSAFFNPGFFYPSIGFTMNPTEFSKFDFGISGLKISWIADKHYFEKNNAEELYGIKKNKRIRCDGGFQFQANLNWSVFKHIHWIHNSNAFFNINNPRQPDIDFRNNFSMSAGKHFQANLLTRYSYSGSRLKPSIFEGEIGFGYFFQSTGN